MNSYNSISMKGTPVVIREERIMLGGHEISVKIEFDLSKLPEELYEAGIKIAQNY